MGTALWYLRRPVAIIALIAVAAVVAVLLVTALAAGAPHVRSSGHAILVPTLSSLLTHAQTLTDNPSSLIEYSVSLCGSSLPTSGTERTQGSRAAWSAVGP